MNNPIKQFYIHWKKHGLRKTLKDFKRNFLILQTPEKITKQKIQGTIGSIVGLLIILIVFYKKDMYYALIAVFFGIYLQYISLKQLYLQKQTLQDIKNQYEEVVV